MRINKLLLLAATGVTALSAVTSAVAAVPVPFGWYGELNLGSSRTNGVNYAPGATVARTGFGWNLDVGYKFMPYFAAEMGYTSYATTYAKIHGYKVAKDEHYSFDLAGKGILPINETGFDMFAKLGVQYAHNHVSAPSVIPGVTVNTGKNSSTGLYFGLGGEYAILPNLLGTVQWARAKSNSNIGNLDLYSVGVNYTFG